MHTYLLLSTCLLTLTGPLCAQDATATTTTKSKPPVIQAPDNPPPQLRQSRTPTPYPPQPRGVYPRPTRWEYCIFEIRIRESEIGGGLFQLHMPGRSSGRTKDLGKVFREVHMQMQKTSRIDEINALNTLGALGWELTSTQKKDGRTGISVFYYFKRRI